MTNIIQNIVLRGAAALLGAFAIVAPAAAQDSPPVKATHGAWEVRCSEEGKCLMSQTFKDKEGRSVLAMVLRKLEKPAQTDNGEIVATARIITPLNVMLIRQLGMRIDGGEIKTTPFLICTQVGCEARPPIKQPLIDEFKAGSKIEFLTEVPTSEGPKVVAVEISLSGFSDAYNDL